MDPTTGNPALNESEEEFVPAEVIVASMVLPQVLLFLLVDPNQKCQRNYFREMNMAIENPPFIDDFSSYKPPLIRDSPLFSTGEYENWRQMSWRISNIRLYNLLVWSWSRRYPAKPAIKKKWLSPVISWFYLKSANMDNDGSAASLSPKKNHFVKLEVNNL